MPPTNNSNPAELPVQAVTTRRQFLGRLAAFTFVGAGATTLLAACGGGDAPATGDVADTTGTAGGAAPSGDYPVVDASTCQGYDALDEQALAMRNALNYQDASPEADKHCGNCQLKQAYEADAQCLGCQLFAGPVSPGGWCQSWVAMPA